MQCILTSDPRRESDQGLSRSAFAGSGGKRLSHISIIDIIISSSSSSSSSTIIIIIAMIIIIIIIIIISSSGMTIITIISSTIVNINMITIIITIITRLKGLEYGNLAGRRPARPRRANLCRPLWPRGAHQWPRNG